MLELSSYGSRRLIRDFLKWLPVFEQVRTFCITPEPEVRVQMDLFNVTISGSPLAERVGLGLTAEE